MIKKLNQYYSAPQLAKLLGVNNSTVKRWVDKKIFPAKITSGGHRRIYKDDILRFLKTKKRSSRYSYILRQMQYGPTQIEQSEDYFQFLHRMERLPETSKLEKLFITGTNIDDLIENIVVPTLRKIGEEWSNGKLDIYTEHRMTFLLRQELQSLERLMPSPKKDAPVAILACVTNEHHEIPLALCDLVLKNHGYRTIMLGINTPPEEAAKAANDLRADLIVLAKIYSSFDENVYLKTLTTNLKNKQNHVALGGRGWTLKDHNYTNISYFDRITDVANARK